MTLFDMSIIGAIAGTVFTVIVYLYLYTTYRERYMGIWILSWICYFTRLIVVDRQVFFWQDSIFAIVYACISILNAFLLAWGMHEFIGKKMKSWWLYLAAIVAVLSLIIIPANIPFALKPIPGALFFGMMYIWTGLIFLKKINIRGFGVRLVGVSIVLLGVHGIDFIFLRFIEWWLPWAYLIDTVLRFIIAFGTLLVYLEKTRNDLALQEKSYRLLAENAADAIYRYRLIPEPGLEYISPAIASITGYAPAEFYADPQLTVKIVCKEDQLLLGNFQQSLTTSRKSPLTVRLICKDQKHIWVEQKNVPIYDDEGQIMAFEGVIRDVTERKQLEQDILRLDRLNIIGEMAASLAHEIRNPLTTVRGYLQFLSKKNDVAHYQERFDLMIDEIDRTNLIISEYLSFCKDKVADLQLYQLNNIIKALLPLMQSDANATSAQVELRLGDIPELYLDEREIRQLILNLVRNGLEAMTVGRLLALETFVEAGEIVLAVRDQGAGIPSDVLEKLGTPFFTTKDSGTGLGLAACYRIANRHQATITVKTGIEGTTFFVRFAQRASSK